MLALAGGIARRGFAVDLVLVRRQGAYVEDIPANIRVIELGTKRTVNSVAALARYLRRERPAVLLTALVHVNVAALLAGLLARVGTRLVVTEHNQISRNISPTASRTVRMAYRLVPFLYPRAARIIAVSDGVAEDLTRFTGMERARIDVAHNPVVTPDMVAKAAQPVNHPWFVEGEAPVILGVGRLSAQKDFGTLLRAFALVRDIASGASGDPGGGRLPKLWRISPMNCTSRRMSRCRALSIILWPSWARRRCSCCFPLRRPADRPGSKPWPWHSVVVTDCPAACAEILGGGRVGGCCLSAMSRLWRPPSGKLLDNPVTAERLRGKAEEFTVDRAVDRYLALLHSGAR